MLYHSYAGKKSGTRMGKAVVLTLLLCVMFAACKKEQQTTQPPPPPVSNVVTDDIKEGIENHINEQVRLGKGHFKLPFKENRKKL